jgi:uncharacterized integral membrane protein
MRVALPILLIVLVSLLVMFALTNLDSRVSVTLWNRTYPSAHLVFVVLASMSVGAILVGIVAIIEGAAIRLANRRLRREIQRLETENNFLRTQRSAEPQKEPDVPQEEPTARGELEQAEERWRQGQLASAPVYDPGSPPKNE